MSFDCLVYDEYAPSSKSRNSSNKAKVKKKNSWGFWVKQDSTSSSSFHGTIFRILIYIFF